MSKKTYKLRIPIPGEGESLPEFVSHGNLEATLVPGKLVETSDANFARHLELSYGLTQEKADVETGSEASDDSDGKEFDDAQADETAAKKTNKRRN